MAQSRRKRHATHIQLLYMYTIGLLHPLNHNHPIRSVEPQLLQHELPPVFSRRDDTQACHFQADIFPKGIKTHLLTSTLLIAIFS